MIDEPCELSIARLYGAQEGAVVRIDARRDGRILGRIDVPLERFAAALMGEGAIPALFSDEHKMPPPKRPR